MSREDVWWIRDNRSLSWSAKLVWLMLESRGDDCRPSLATIAADCGISRSTVIRAITELADGGCLKVAPTVNEDRTSACNSYKPVVPGGGADSVTQTPQGVTQTPGGVSHRHGGGVTQTPEEEKGSVKRTTTDSLRSSVGDAAKRGSRVPDDFLGTLRADPDQIAWFLAECSDVDGRVENDKFMDYWRAKPGAAGRKIDWIATWRNWMRKAQQDATRFGRRRPADRNEHNNATLAAYVARQQADAPTPARPSLRVISGELDTTERRAIQP